LIEISSFLFFNSMQRIEFNTLCCKFYKTNKKSVNDLTDFLFGVNTPKDYFALLEAFFVLEHFPQLEEFWLALEFDSLLVL